MVVVYSLLIYIASGAVITVGGRPMWDFMLVCAVVTVSLVLLYLVAGMKYGDFNANAFQLNTPSDDAVNGHTDAERTDSQVWFVGGIEAFYVTFPGTFWFFGGVETTGVIGEEVVDVSVGCVLFSCALLKLLLPVIIRGLPPSREGLWRGPSARTSCTSSCSSSAPPYRQA
jgi:amino acid transporter